MSTTSKKWFAVNTQNKSERKVCILLNKKKIETFYPINKIVFRHGEKEKVHYEPLLQNYVFVFASESEHNEIKNIEGIKSLMYWLGEPAIIKTDEIDMLKHILSEHQNLSIEKIRINVQEPVSVNEFSYMEDQSYSDTNKKYLKVSLPSLGYAIVAEVRTQEGKIISLQSLNQDKIRRAII